MTPHDLVTYILLAVAFAAVGILALAGRRNPDDEGGKP